MPVKNRIIRDARHIEQCYSCRHATSKGDIVQPGEKYGVRVWVPVVLCDRKRCLWEPII